MERESGFHGLIGVMFSRAWSCSFPCTGLLGTGPVVGAGPVGHGYHACREMICSPPSSPSGCPYCDTWHPGNKVTILLWHHGGSRPYYQERRQSWEESKGESDLRSHIIQQGFLYPGAFLLSSSRVTIVNMLHKTTWNIIMDYMWIYCSMLIKVIYQHKIIFTGRLLH